MTFLPQYIWNEIAETQSLKSGWAEYMFGLDAEEIDDEKNRQRNMLRFYGYSNKVALACLHVLPLYLEHQAITRYINDTGSAELRTALPEVLNIKEACRLMEREYRLNEEQLRELATLLRTIQRNSAALINRARKPFIISLAGLRGGTGKTTLTFELGKAFASRNKRVLLVDMDPKSDLTRLAGMQPDPEFYCLADVLLKKTALMNVTADKGEFHVSIATHKLTSAEGMLLHPADGITRLKSALAEVSLLFDVIIADCPPSLGRLTQNAIAASNLVIAPVLDDLNTAHAVELLKEEVETIQDHHRNGLSAFKLLRVLCDGKEAGNQSLQVLNDLSDTYESQMLQTTIRNLTDIRAGYRKGQLTLQLVSTEEIDALCNEITGSVPAL